MIDLGPVVIELRGGCFDGERRTLIRFRRIIALAVPVPPTPMHDPPPTRMAEIPTEKYRFTGSILDDGTRVFKKV